MLKIYVTSALVILSLVLATVTSGRFIQDTDDRDKRQVGDLKTAEYLAYITLNQMHKLPTHCTDIACGLVDVLARLIKRTMSDQRLAELQALIALSKGQGIPVAHGQIDPWRIGKKRKRSSGSLFSKLDDDQSYKLLQLLTSRDQDRLS